MSGRRVRYVEPLPPSRRIRDEPGKLILVMTGIKRNLYPEKISDPLTWVDRHGDYLFGYSLMRVRNREMAENLVQETFLAALTGRFTFRGRSSEKTWLVGILKHKIIDQFRKNSRMQSVSELKTDPEQTIDDFYDAAGHPQQYPRDWMPDPQALLHSREFWEVFRSCLNRLPERTASVFVMRELDGFSTKEICRVFGITPANVWVILYKARLQLRQLLESCWLEKDSRQDILSTRTGVGNGQ